MKELISKGSTSFIYKITDIDKGYILKLLDSRVNTRQIISVETAYKREVRALKSLSHRNIIGLIAHEQLSPSEFSISLPYCSGGTLFSALHRSSIISLSLRQKKKMMADILGAVQAIHSLRDPLIHGDIKSLNLLLVSPLTRDDSVPWVKLCDFGSSRFKSESPSNGTVTVGTIQWMPPEVIEGATPGTEADIYSVGIVLQEIVYRKIPFDDTQDNLIMGMVLRGERPRHYPQLLERDKILNIIPIIDECLSGRPGTRPTIERLQDQVNGLFVSSGISSGFNSISSTAS